MTLFADVVFPLPLTQSFSYIVPPGLEASVRIGARVFAPLAKKILVGFIVGIREGEPESAVAYKEILNAIEAEPVVSLHMLSFTGRLSRHYCSSWGEFLQAAVPPFLALRSSARMRLTEKGKEAFLRKALSPEEMKVARVLGERVFSSFHVRRKSGVKTIGPLAARMAKKGLLETWEEPRLRPKRKKADVEDNKTRGPSQLELDFAGSALPDPLSVLAQPFREGSFAPLYLFGSAAERQSSYIQVVRRALDRSGQVLFMVPEVASSSLLKEVLEKRLGERIALLHGQMSERAQEIEWKKIRDGRAKVAVGPRSVLFSPLDTLSLVIADEEHDESYFNAENPVYDARRGAWMRALEHECPVVYGSDVPSVEMFYRARAGGWLVALPGAVDGPPADVVDDRLERGLITKRFLEGLRKSLAAGGSSLVFLNRRGYASYLVCPSCGHIPKCQRCNISLIYSKKRGRLFCRYCSGEQPAAASCAKCGGRVLEPRGAGVEAVEEEFRRLLPNAAVAGFDSDRVRTKAARESVLRRFGQGKIDILVGTQLLARQRSLPGARFVGILFPEATLGLSDFRASERTFQSIRRMMRLAATPGRGTEIVIQTSCPDHYSIREAARRDYVAFFEEETRFRGLMNYPPYSAMAEIVLYGRDLRSLGRKARDLAAQVKASSSDVEVLGPALAPLSAGRGRRGIQMVLKSRKADTFEACLCESLKSVRTPKSVWRYD
jgi:primosomal protein N' (replication factor Y)